MDKKTRLTEVYNRCLVRWGFPEKVSDNLPMDENGFVVGEMDEFLSDANFGWYKDEGINEQIGCVTLYYDLDTDRLKVMAFIDGKDLLVGYIKTTVDDVIRMLEEEDGPHEDISIMIDAVDSFFGLQKDEETYVAQDLWRHRNDENGYSRNLNGKVWCIWLGKVSNRMNRENGAFEEGLYDDDTVYLDRNAWYVYHHIDSYHDIYRILRGWGENEGYLYHC